MAINDIVQSHVQTAGDIKIDEISIISSAGDEINIKAFIGELNLFEDMYASGMYGNILIFDNVNLSQIIGLTGDEFLRIKMSTPSMPDSEIYKAFKVYSITDKMMVNDTGRQSYIMHFCSPELFADSLSPIYKTYSGKIDSIVEEIFDQKLACSRTGTGSYTPLIIIGDTVNQAKFTSTGWRPMRCINYMASRAIGSGYKNPGYLFYESNKAYYFVNVEQIFDTAKQNKSYYQDYYYVVNNLTGDPNLDSYIKNIDNEYKKVEEMKVIESFNSLKNSNTGYLANRLFTFDMLNKTYNVWDYDHVENWGAYKHLEDIGNGSRPPFPSGTQANGQNGALRSPAGYNQVQVQHRELYTGFKNNTADRISEIKPQRTSTLNELNNFKLEITVPGRTDIEVGAIVNFHYPAASPRDATDKNLDNFDELYSGYYLVVAIRHKVTLLKHMMILELVKDSYRA